MVQKSRSILLIPASMNLPNPKLPRSSLASQVSGKSTWTKWLQREALSTRWNGLAIRIELRSLSSNNLPKLHDLIRDSVGIHLADELTAARIRTWLDTNRVCFILDGFDELVPDCRDLFFDWLVEFRSAAKDCPFILTSRPLTTNHLDKLAKAWQAWKIEPFDKQRIIEYIRRWYSFTPLLVGGDQVMDATSLAEEWLNDPTIGPLTGNPLLLSTLLMVHHLDGRLPAGRSQLYRRYVDGMLGIWDDRRHINFLEHAFFTGAKRELIRGLALFMFSGEKEQLEELEVLNWITSYLADQRMADDPEQVLRMLRERTGLIIGPGIYSFVHKSVAEYLVAEAVLQGDYIDTNGKRIDRLYLFENRDNDRWNTVTFLWAGLTPVMDLEVFIQACMDSSTASVRV